MVLETIDIPAPKSLRRGWAALAAVYAARGWGSDVGATSNEWRYHDGGGNWACLRFVGDGRAVLVGHDHEYSDTYFGAAADYFDEEETDLLAGAPAWWAEYIDPKPFGEWIGFVYGWDGLKWQRAVYEPNDGFESVGLLRDCQGDRIAKFAAVAPGRWGEPPSEAAVEQLIQADASITAALLKSIVPGWNIVAGVDAACRFKQAKIA